MQQDGKINKARDSEVSEVIHHCQEFLYSITITAVQKTGRSSQILFLYLKDIPFRDEEKNSLHMREESRVFTAL